MSVDELLEACRLYHEAEKNLEDQRENLGWALLKAKKSVNVTELSRLTNIKRPSIYWLMRRVVNNHANGNKD